MGIAHSSSSCLDGVVDETKKMGLQNHDRHITTAPREMRASVRMWGCVSDEEHRCKNQMFVEMLHPLKGEEGLIASGLEYRLVTIQDDGQIGEAIKSASATTTTTPLIATTASMMDHPHLVSENKNDNGDLYECRHNNEKNTCVMDSKRKSHTRKERKENTFMVKKSSETIMRLFHKESNNMITTANRKEYIADGAMYDIICRLAMEYSIDLMIKDGGLRWITASAEVENQSEPVRVLVSARIVEDESRLDNEPTLLIATGNGKVRAGIFSRQHLLTSGLECSSAIQFVREARKRNMNLIITDPNVHGDRVGMATFEMSISHLFHRWEKEEVMTEESTLKQRNLYVLSHSQSGAQFVRYLLNKSDRYLPHIRAIAFTDSTHNIQWTKIKHQEGLKNFLESDECVYFKRSDEITDHILAPLPTLGRVVDTNTFWEHRFGKIKTLCAGTSEHSLTNWFASKHIWAHFDQYLPNSKMPN